MYAEEDLISLLKKRGAYYSCPKDSDGKPLGPLVGYTAKYLDATTGEELNYVGFEYWNFSKADPDPRLLSMFASVICPRILELNVDLVVGAPWAGIKFSQEVARLLPARHIFAEKQGSELVLGRYEGEINRGDRVLIGEELVNNASTTNQLINLIEWEGAKVVGISCAINRSSPFIDSFLKSDGTKIPIYAAVEKSTPQYKQDHPLVAEAIKAGNWVPKPKYDWPRLADAMKQ